MEGIWEGGGGGGWIDELAGRYCGWACWHREGTVRKVGGRVGGRCEESSAQAGGCVGGRRAEGVGRAGARTGGWEDARVSRWASVREGRRVGDLAEL